MNLRNWISKKLDGLRSYDSAFAEAPDDSFVPERTRELAEVGPLVVAGSDLDFGPARVNLIFATITNPYAAEGAAYASAVAELYAAPEVKR